ncbi:MAG: glycosyltransferase family 4 protein [Lacipirellulaceae bacterium]
MRIAYLAAGAAGMYCGSCLHDNTLARAMIALGEEVWLVPTYTPIRTDEPNVSVPRVFFGGVNAYLNQASPLLRRAPRWATRLLDQPWLLRLATSGAASIDPAKLGPLTVSMLRGEGGNQAKQLDELADWLVREARPDVVHLSNSMLLGMARRIEERAGPPIVCALSGEDLFLEDLTEPHYTQARELLRERAAEVAAFTALNGYYADFMADYLSVPRERFHVVPHGLDLEGLELDNPNAAREGPLRVGYLARVCRAKGLHLLVEAAELLAARRPELRFEVAAAGYLGAADRPYLIDLQRRVERGPLAGRFRYLGEVDRAAKFAFLRSLDLFATPTTWPEAKGLPAIEALAAGLPVVLPRHGAFPELVAETGAGVLHEPGDALSLSEAIERLLDDPEERARLGQAGAAAIRHTRTATQMAAETLTLYNRLLPPK